jgi:ribonuclease VapC
MVVDTSALMAILFQESDAPRYTEALAVAAPCRIASPTWVEAGIVIEVRYGAAGLLELDELAIESDLAIVPFTSDHARVAMAAFRHYGKGRHRASLNYGDCFSYALAKASGEPLLFKGNDFIHTDVTAAIALPWTTQIP